MQQNLLRRQWTWQRAYPIDEKLINDLVLLNRSKVVRVTVNERALFRPIRPFIVQEDEGAVHMEI